MKSIQTHLIDDNPSKADNSEGSMKIKLPAPKKVPKLDNT